jgi:hypothetical protein
LDAARLRRRVVCSWLTNPRFKAQKSRRGAMSSKERNKIAILLFCLWVVLSITNSVAQNSHINALSLKAQQAESRGNSELADKLFLQAIGEAKRTDSKTYIELVSRLVRERASNNKLGTADTYIQQALNAVSRNIRASGYNADTSVWMDDIAETLYDQGGRTNDEHIKDYCAECYQKLANPTADAGNNSTTSSGQVVAYEALAKLENGRGDKILSHSFEGKAVHLRAQHPDWSRSNNPAPEQFFAIWGYLPYPLEPIPTHRVY